MITGLDPAAAGGGATINHQPPKTDAPQNGAGLAGANPDANRASVAEQIVAEQDVATLHAKVDALTAQVATLVERQRWQSELVGEAMPIVKLGMDAMSERLQTLEEGGWVRFGEAVMGIGERIVGTYGPDDVAELGDAIVGILDTVRSMTQPAILNVANNASAAIERADEVAPVGMVGMVKASQDDDVQRGMAVMLEVLRNVGKGVRRAKLERRLGGQRPRPAAADRRRTAPPAQAVRPRQVRTNNGAAPACAITQPGPAATVSPMPELGVPLTDEGYLADPHDWSEELAGKLAATVGVAELGEQHWQVIHFARTEFLDKSVSPNIRRLTGGTGLNTRQVYQLFPKAPGKSIARVAGIPKPAGCI